MGNFGWGFYLDIAAAGVLVCGAFAVSRAPEPQRAPVRGAHSPVQ